FGHRKSKICLFKRKRVFIVLSILIIISYNCIEIEKIASFSLLSRVTLIKINKLMQTLLMNSVISPRHNISHIVLLDSEIYCNKERGRFFWVYSIFHKT